MEAARPDGSGYEEVGPGIVSRACRRGMQTRIRRPDLTADYFSFFLQAWYGWHAAPAHGPEMRMFLFRRFA